MNAPLSSRRAEARRHDRHRSRSRSRSRDRFSPRRNSHHSPPRSSFHRSSRYQGDTNKRYGDRDNDRPPHRPPSFCGPSHLPVKHRYRINPNAPPDEKLVSLAVDKEDPRGADPLKRISLKAKRNGAGRNTESFDPADTLVRPDLRVWVGPREKRVFNKKLKHDDVVIVPELFGAEDNWEHYYQLLSEMNILQKDNTPGSEWISWHEGAHLISKHPQGAPTYEKVIDRLCEYFQIKKDTVGTRFNWYRDSSDWKPFHHDSAAFNPGRAKHQNITVGVSFGACRELAFLRASPQQNGDKVRVYFPQTNNGVFSFGRDVNILWKHGLNALLEEEQDGKGRISIILWGLAEGVVEEKGSPALLGSDGHGPHAVKKDYGRGTRNGREKYHDLKDRKS